MSKKEFTSMKHENPDLQKQIGCISGFFQLFDRHRFLTAQHNSSHGQNLHAQGGTSKHIKEQNQNSKKQKATAKNVNVAPENQQFSTESSVTSLSSSSSSSSMSSIEFNRTIQIEPPPISQIKIPENTNSGAAMKQPNTPGNQSLDFVDIIKDSMHREPQVLSVKTVPEKKGRILKYIDSPRPLQAPKSINESFHVAAKSQRKPWDSPRLSYDGIGRDMQETFKSGTKHKELPRLSLDSRQGSIKGFNEGTKSHNLLKGKGNESSSITPKKLHEPETSRRQSSVVVKLMGLETFPDSTETCNTPRGVLSNCTNNRNETFAKASESSIKASNPSFSVYGEIEKRIADLQFKNSGKDLRALKQILEAMQRYKDSLDVTRDQASNSPSNSSSLSESSKLVQSPRMQQKDATSMSNSTERSKLPIVIMKPAKNPTNGRLVEKKTAKGISSTTRLLKNPSSQPLHSVDKSNKLTNSKLMQSSKVLQVNGENKNNLSNTLETRSPRRVQKKFGLEKHSPPTSPSLDSTSNKTNHNKQSLELSSPCTTPRQKLSTFQERNEHFRKISYQRSYFNSERSMDSHNDRGGIRVEHSERNNSDSIQLNGLNNAAKELSEDNFMAERIVTTAEQPSPVSVLDAAFYTEDPPSPVKKKSGISKDLDEALKAYDSSEDKSSEDLPLSFNTTEANFNNGSSDIDLKTQNLVQILQQIDYKDEKLTIVRDSTDPDHKYISEILLASGLLSSPSSNQPVHSLGHPINPKLFLALEQIKTNKMHLNIEHNSKKITRVDNPERMQRKLIFDVVNDILVKKLILESSSTLWYLPNKPAGRELKGPQLLDGLCTEIDRLQNKTRNVGLANEDEDLTSLLWEELTHHVTIGKDCNSEIPNVVLDIERLIFKDLITEVVRGEVANLPGRHCTQMLFSK